MAQRHATDCFVSISNKLLPKKSVKSVESARKTSSVNPSPPKKSLCLSALVARIFFKKKSA